MDKRSIVFILLLTATIFLVNYIFPPSSAKIAPIAPIKSAKVVEPSVEKKIVDEEFFVLENDYLQLVFSSAGGSLSEINLPFKSKSNKDSVVLPIEFDDIFAKQYVANDHFPAFASKRFDGKMEEGKVGGYYPLLRRSIFAQNREVQHMLPPRYYALHVMGEESELERLPFKLVRFEKNLIEFEAEQPHRKIIKTYTFAKEAPYTFDFTIKIEGDSKGLYLTSGLPEVELISGNFVPSLKYRIEKGQKFVTEDVDLPKGEMTVSSFAPDWVSNSNGFFGIIVDPLTEIAPGYRTKFIEGGLAPTRISLIDAQYDLYPVKKYPAYEIMLPLRSTTSHFRIISGPLQDSVLKVIDKDYENEQTSTTPGYITAPTYKGWFSFVSEPFAKFLFILMNFFHKITYSWGISIIILTIVLRIMLYPLNAWTIKSSLKMQEIGPEVKALQDRYKKDPKRAQMEIMNLYREKKINPFTGCLPLLIQMPFLIGMFDLLRTTFELRGVSFIPGWINNLTAPDVVFRWGYPIFFIGNELHLLPVLLGVVMYIQQKMSSKLPKDKSQWTDQQKQQMFMGNVMAVVFAVMFYNFPSGLNIYWLSSMLLGILQQWYMMRFTMKMATK